MSRDKFPIGMRVLAVDDDPICLKLLESLLIRCQYHVTTTNQAILALKMLRENKDQFDLVISDVHMPDMDGFKLLELVGLEMDLPVIMLSANGETQAVMKGIDHGAVDYLLKPVRLEELKNIWQHVIRKKKFEPKDNLDSGDETKPRVNNSCERNDRSSKKRKGPNEESFEDEDNEGENDDQSTQKKPRVVWSIELHQKFVAAVNQLGMSNAVPKKILDMMNVENLTRENVASHLQKYRLYLKRLDAAANQQANMVAAYRGPIGTMDTYPNFNVLSSTLPRRNYMPGYGVQDIVPSARTLATSTNPMNSLAKNQGIIPGMTTPMDPFAGNSSAFPLVGQMGHGRHASSLRMKEDTNLLNFGSLGNSKINQVNLGYNTLANISLPRMGFDSGCSSSQDINVLMNGQINFSSSYVAEDPKNAKSEIFMDGFKPKSGFGSSLEDLVNSMIKPERQDYNIVDGGESWDSTISIPLVNACESHRFDA